MYRTWFGSTRIEYPLVPLYCLSYDSVTARIRLSLPEVPTLQLPPLAHMHTLEIPYSSSMLHPYVIGRGTLLLYYCTINSANIIPHYSQAVVTHLLLVLVL